MSQDLRAAARAQLRELAFAARPGDDVREGRLVPLLPGYHLPEIEVLAVFPSRRHLSAKVRVMVDFLVEAFKGTPPWDRQAGGLEAADADLVHA